MSLHGLTHTSCEPLQICHHHHAHWNKKIVGGSIDWPHSLSTQQFISWSQWFVLFNVSLRYGLSPSNHSFEGDKQVQLSLFNYPHMSCRTALCSQPGVLLSCSWPFLFPSRHPLHSLTLMSIRAPKSSCIGTKGIVLSEICRALNAHVAGHETSNSALLRERLSTICLTGRHLSFTAWIYCCLNCYSHWTNTYLQYVYAIYQTLLSKVTYTLRKKGAI